MAARNNKSNTAFTVTADNGLNNRPPILFDAYPGLDVISVHEDYQQKILDEAKELERKWSIPSFANFCEQRGIDNMFPTCVVFVPTRKDRGVQRGFTLAKVWDDDWYYAMLGDESGQMRDLSIISLTTASDKTSQALVKMTREGTWAIFQEDSTRYTYLQSELHYVARYIEALRSLVSIENDRTFNVIPGEGK